LSGSVECGVSEYLKSIEAQLNWQWGESYSNLRRLDEGLRQGHFRLKGRTIDLEPYRVQADGVVSRALRALRNKVGAGQEIDEIVLVGGGGPFFLAGLKAAFPEHPLHQVQDPVFANVRGFQLIGEALRKRKAA
jgi:plasmid segregation protein ParM